MFFCVLYVFYDVGANTTLNGQARNYIKSLLYISLVAGDNCVVLYIIMVCGGMGMCKEVSW